MAVGFKCFFCLCAMYFSTSSVQAQRLRVLADGAFDQLQFATADSLYNMYFESQKDTAALIRRAYCSIAQGKYNDAVLHFEKSNNWVYKDLSWCGDYADVLCKTGQVDSCRVVANRCLQRLGTNDILTTLATQSAISEQFAADQTIQMEELRFVGHNECWSPVPYGNAIIFTAPSHNKKVKDNWTGKPFTQLYIGDSGNGKNEPVPIDMAVDLHIGSPAFYDSKMMYFTSNSLKPSKYNEYNLHIAKAGKTNVGQWVHSGIFPYSSPEYSTAYPCFSTNDSIMIFSSDKMGGKGGFDLYMCHWKLGKWDEPIHLKEISTTADDIFPWIDGDDTLYFSTEGLSGMGGLDIFKVFLSEMSTTPPVNIGLPYNSVADDFGYIRQGDQIFITSSRSGVDKIYKSVIINNH